MRSLVSSQLRSSSKAKGMCIRMQIIRLYTKFLLRFLKLISNIGLKYFSDLIKILYITKFLKSYSQMLSALVGCYYTLKIEFTHNQLLFIYGAHLFLRIMYD